jgi:hypothetical protein
MKKRNRRKKHVSKISLHSNKDFPGLPVKKIEKKIIQKHIIYQKAKKGYMILSGLPILQNSIPLPYFH